MAKKKTTASKPTTRTSTKKAATKKKAATPRTAATPGAAATTPTAATRAPGTAAARAPGAAAAAETAKATPPPAPPKAAVEAEAKDLPQKMRRPSLLSGLLRNERQPIRCYLCGERFEVSGRTMSTTCTACHKAIKVEDVQVKSYLPVNVLQTCGQILVTKRGRVAAKRIQSGRGIICEGTLEGSIETDGKLELGAKSSWKGKELQCRALTVADGATLNGHVQVPWERD